MKTFIVFDLDDTLFPEHDYVESAYRHIADVLERESGYDRDKALRFMHLPGNPFDNLSAAIGQRMSIPRMLEIYRTHRPDLHLESATAEALAILRNRDVGMGLLTEGRIVTQTNKIEALHLWQFLTVAPMITEPRERGGDGKSFALYTADITADHFVSVGDNPSKDFAQPNSMGWITIAIADRGFNIHPQNFGSVAPEYRPQFIIRSISELPELLRDLSLA